MNIGSILLSLALPASLYGLFASALGGKPAIGKSKKAAHLVTALLLMASIMLVYFFVTDAFNIEYVYSYSSLSLPLLYKLSGLWAGLDGSLLFWVLILSVFTSMAASKTRFIEANAVLQAIITFFLIMLVFEANPFTELMHVPDDGRGLNPLLQNFFMLIHPPVLYLGYVGFAVPFAYVLAALIKREGTDNIMKELRIWTVASWLFLTLGNLLGAMWAYVELGWGGFWAWDPVENAGIMPWFTATAFLHSIIMQERRGMLSMWNMLLVILTFLLTIFGTFITRSGIIRSVHSFSDVTIGMYFIAFMIIATVYSLYLLVSRRKNLKGTEKLETIFSREGSFYLNNLILVFGLVAMTWGTMLPLFAELFTGQKMEVGPAFFNRTLAPVGIALLFLTGIGPEMSWRKIRRGLFRREFLAPSIFAATAGILAFAFGIRKWFPILAASGATFVIATVADEFVRASGALNKRFKMGFIASFFGLIRTAPRRYGGYVVHLGVALLFIGIAGSSYQSEYQLNLKRGVPETAGGYEFTLNSLDWVTGRESEGAIARVKVRKGVKTIGELKPALFMHRNQPKPFAEIDLIIKPLKDVYLAMGGISEEGETAEFQLTINPLISFVWIGGLIMLLGTVVAILPRKSFKPFATEADEEIGIDIALDRADREDFRS